MDKVLVDKPKPPFALYRKRKRRFEITLTKRGDQIWACGECGVLYTPWGQGDEPRKRAAACCKQQYCACGQKIERGYTGPKCSPCNSFDRETARLAKATEIEAFDGPVYDDHRDKYWTDLGDFEDWVQDQIDDDERDNLPEWIYPCETKAFAKLDATSLIENYVHDEHHDDAFDSIEDLDGFQKFLDEWCAKQTLQSWSPDFARKISVEKILKTMQPVKETKE